MTEPPSKQARWECQTGDCAAVEDDPPSPLKGTLAPGQGRQKGHLASATFSIKQKMYCDICTYIIMYVHRYVCTPKGS